MTRRIPAVVAVLLLLAAVTSAAPLVRELPLNVKVKGSVEIDGGADTYVFDAIAGLELTVTLKGGSRSVLPVLDIVDPLGVAVPIPPPSSSGKTKLSKHLVTTAGRHYLRVAVTRAGEYTLKLKAAAADLEQDLVIPAAGQGEMTFECLAGMTTKIKASEGEKNGPAPVFHSWTDPAAAAVSTDYVRDRSSGFKAKASSMTKEGEYRLRVSLEGGVEGTATIRVSRSDPPKAGTILEDDLLAGKVEKIRRRGPGATDEDHVFAASLLDTGSIQSVTLEIPGRDDRELTRNVGSGQWALSAAFADDAALLADFPDGSYVLRIHREGEVEDETLAFTVEGAFPDDAFAISPADGFVGAALAPTVTWSAVTGATGYDANISREGLNSGLYEFSTDDPAETSCDVTPGLLVDGPVYLLTLSARTDGLKTSQRTTRFSTSTTGLGFASAVIEKQLVTRPGVAVAWGEDDYHFAFTAHFTGKAVRAAQVEWLSPSPIPIAYFRPVSGSPDFDLNLRWEIPRGLGWGNAVAQTYSLMPDGDYQFRLTYIDGTQEVTDPISVGGRVHEFGSLTGPSDGKPANVLTPSWNFRQDEDLGTDLARTYRVVIDEPSTGEVAYEEEIDVTRSAGNVDYLVEPFTVPPGVLEKKREYRLTWISANGTGWSTRVWTSFSTGSDLNYPAFASVGKDHRRDGDGVEKYVFLAEVAGTTLRRARIRDPQGNLLALESKGQGFFRLKISFDTEEDLDQALPDGIYEYDLEYDDGTPDLLRQYGVSGDYPAIPEISTPAHDQKKVARDPGIAWTYSAEDAAGIQGFFVRITDVSLDVIPFSRSLPTTVRDTKVPSTAKLRSGKKQELEVYALGPTRKNAKASVVFKTK